MNCLIVSPHSSYWAHRNYIRSGIAYIAAAVKRMDGIKVVTVNLDLQGYADPRGEVVRLLKEHKIDAILSGGHLTDLQNLRIIFRATKRHNPRIVTVTGGPVLSHESELAMDMLENADYGIIGEGERTVAELLAALRDGQTTTEIPGLIIKTEEGFTLTPPRENINDWAEIPWPDYDAFGGEQIFNRKYSPSDYAHATRSIPIATGRGCPFRCTFCHNSQGNIYRKRPLPYVLEELEYYIRHYQRRDHYIFLDDLVATTPAKVVEICQALEPYKLQDTFMFLRGDGVTEESAKWLKRAGITRVGVGLDSGSEKVLKSMDRRITRSQVENALNLLLKEGLTPLTNMIFGDREEDWETVKESLAWREAHPEFNINVGFIQLYPGSRLYKYADDQGKIINKRAHLENGRVFT